MPARRLAKIGPILFLSAVISLVTGRKCQKRGLDQILPTSCSLNFFKLLCASSVFIIFYHSCNIFVMFVCLAKCGPILPVGSDSSEDWTKFCPRVVWQNLVQSSLLGSGRKSQQRGLVQILPGNVLAKFGPITSAVISLVTGRK